MPNNRARYARVPTPPMPHSLALRSDERGLRLDPFTRLLFLGVTQQARLQVLGWLVCSLHLGVCEWFQNAKNETVRWMNQNMAMAPMA